MNSFIRSPTRAIAPRLPCTEKFCTICDSHFRTEEVIKLDLPTPRPSLWSSWLSEIPKDEWLLPHLEFAKTPERIR
jgi:hypothetical protein